MIFTIREVNGGVHPDFLVVVNDDELPETIVEDVVSQQALRALAEGILSLLDTTKQPPILVLEVDTDR
jgi:hypothetical protein